MKNGLEFSFQMRLSRIPLFVNTDNCFIQIGFPQSQINSVSLLKILLPPFRLGNNETTEPESYVNQNILWG